MNKLSSDYINKLIKIAKKEAYFKTEVSPFVTCLISVAMISNIFITSNKLGSNKNNAGALDYIYNKSVIDTIMENKNISSNDFISIYSKWEKSQDNDKLFVRKVMTYNLEIFNSLEISNIDNIEYFLKFIKSFEEKYEYIESDKYLYNNSEEDIILFYDGNLYNLSSDLNYDPDYYYDDTLLVLSTLIFSGIILIRSILYLLNKFEKGIRKYNNDELIASLKNQRDLLLLYIKLEKDIDSIRELLSSLKYYSDGDAKEKDIISYANYLTKEIERNIKKMQMNDMENLNEYKVQKIRKNKNWQ